jgi:adenylate cyclase
VTLEDSGSVLVVDDQDQNRRLLDAVLGPRGFSVRSCSSGEEALAEIAADMPDVVLLDILMPGMDGYEVCRRIRTDPATELLFVAKPFDQSELLARVRSLVRISRFHRTIRRQAAELAAWNEELEQRVNAQIEVIERMGRLRRFLAPQVAERLLADEDESVLESHRRDIVVVFCDLRGFTPFAETSEPEEVIGVLREYHAALGDLVFRFEGTLERFMGDGIMVFFNDPLPCEDPASRAVRMAVAMRSRVRELAGGWAARGFDLGFSVGIAQGFATLGRIGYEGRFDYAAIGSVTNLADRLCAAADPWQVLITARVQAGLDGIAVSEDAGELTLRGFARPVRTFAVRGLDAARVAT